MENSQTLDKNLCRVWRAFVTPPTANDDEITVYVEASSPQEAHLSVWHLIASLFPAVTVEQATESYYNLHSAAELIDMGVSDNVAYRLFESGWNGDHVCGWEKEPIFAVRRPAALYAAWNDAKLHFESSAQG